MSTRFLVAAALVLASCSKELAAPAHVEPGAGGPSASPVPHPVAAPAPALPSPAAETPAPAPVGAGAVAARPVEAHPQPKVCEVEITGTVVVPKQLAKAGAPTVIVARGDCLAAAPDIVGTLTPRDERYFIEVFVPWGADLTACAALESAPGAPSSVYGKAALAMHAEKEGEVEFHNVTITLTAGPPRSFPRPDAH